MTEKKNSAVQRVFKSIVAPAIGTSIALFMGCTTSSPTDTNTTGVSPVKQPETNDKPPYPGKYEIAPSTQGAVVSPTTTPAPTTVPIPPPGVVARPGIPDPGKIAEPGKIIPAGKPAPQPVGKMVPKPGKVAPPPDVRKVGKFIDPDVELKRGDERPTRATRRATDSHGGVQRTGFVGGRKLT